MNLKQFEFYKPVELGFDDDEMWTDYYIKLSEIRKGDTFYECDHGRNVKLTALSDPHMADGGWYCKVKSETYGVRSVYVSATTNYLNANFSKIPLIMTEQDGNLGFLVE